uniref:BHLH domain-containing protein n=1 Tax=Neolamprologus brichardi TaxID=32507 RepID=A0A3Q4MNM3_NEOBR
LSPVSSTAQLRKPLVEKIRRKRINSSIEQLKSLLGPELLKQQPDSKLEKADILASCKDCSRSVNLWTQHYFRCAQEMVNFLSKVEVKTQSQRNLLNHIKQLHTSSTFVVKKHTCYIWTSEKMRKIHTICYNETVLFIIINDIVF